MTFEVQTVYDKNRPIRRLYWSGRFIGYIAEGLFIVKRKLGHFVRKYKSLAIQKEAVDYLVRARIRKITIHYETPNLNFLLDITTDEYLKHMLVNTIRGKYGEQTFVPIDRFNNIKVKVERKLYDLTGPEALDMIQKLEGLDSGPYLTQEYLPGQNE